MEILSYELGDIIRWAPAHVVAVGDKSDDKYSYGMVIKTPEIIKSGKYYYIFDNSPLAEQDGLRAEQFTAAITVFSFEDQGVLILYQSPEEPPLIIERVSFSEGK